MSDSADSSTPPSERIHDTQRILRALRQAVRDTLRDHKRTGDPAVVWRDGRVVWIPPDDIVIPDDGGEEV
jgi:hypothetical protein